MHAQELRKTKLSARCALVFSIACGGLIGCSGGSEVERLSHGDRTGDASGSGGLAGAGGDAGYSACVDVSHVAAGQKRDLRVIGSGFGTYEGLMVRVLATLREPAYGLGEAPIAGGSFDISLPGVLGDYTGIAVYVDRVRDNACNPDREFIWQQTTGPMSAWGLGATTASGGLVWEVTPDTLRVLNQVGPCSLNGVFDLTIPLPCHAETRDH